MRNLFLSIIFLISILGCRKNSENSTDKGLTGKWVAVEQFRSPGNGGTWHPLSLNDRFTIEFFKDSTFAYSSNFPKADSSFNQYSIDNGSLLMSSTFNIKKDTWYFYPEKTIIDNELSLSIFACIEGCPYGFRRSK